ncbi:MAG: glycosyltransferase family 1 protein [Chloroflexota bacterium]
MHLVINASEIGRQRGGNETFIAGLTEGLAQVENVPDVSLLTCEWSSNARSYPFPQYNIGKYSQLPFFLWQQSLALRKLKADWYVSNFFLPPLLPSSRCKGAVIVHDLSFRAHPEYFPRTVAWYMRWLTGLAIQQADLVCTVSEFSRQELYRFYPSYKGEVHVVPNGVSTQYQPGTTPTDPITLAKYTIKPPYIFALGNIHPRKNLARLLDAYLQLQQHRTDLPPMVWSGHPRWESDDLLNKAQQAGVQFTGFIDQADLPAFYRQATMLVYPSLYEGFGLPPVEAMACGTPSVVSNTTSLPEVVGDAALAVDPMDVSAIADAMARLLDTPHLRDVLVEAGLSHVKSYTWPNTAECLLMGINHTNTRG